MFGDIIPLDHPDLPAVHDDFKTWARKQKVSVESVIRECLYSGGYYLMEFSRDRAGNKIPMRVVSGNKCYPDPEMSAKGPERANIMVIGKCLNEDDVSLERTYASVDGGIMIKGMMSSGFKAKDIHEMYFTNILCTTPLIPGKFFKHWLNAQKILLYQQIMLVKPKLILLQGSDAIKLLLGSKENTTTTEGKVTIKEFDYGGKSPTKVKIVTSMSPTAVRFEQSRITGDNKHRTHADQRFHKQLRHFYRTAVGQADVAVNFKHRIIRNTVELEEDLKRAVSKARDKLVAWDAEWQGAHPQNPDHYIRCIQFTSEENYGSVIALTDPGGKPCFEMPDGKGGWTKKGAGAECARLCKKYMKGHRIVGHYFAADLEVLVPFGLDLREEYDVADKPSKVLTEGGFATELAAHAWDETALFSLDEQMMAHLDIPKYSEGLDTFKKTAKLEHAAQLSKLLKPYNDARRELRRQRKLLEKASKRKKIKPAKLQEYRAKLRAAEQTFLIEQRKRPRIIAQHEARSVEMKSGYGWIPDKVLYPYGAWDVAAELSLAFKYLEYLKCDRFGNDCRKEYWTSHRAALAVLEINTAGLPVDRQRLDDIAVIFAKRRDQLLEQVRDVFNWPDFNPRSRFQFAEALFGEEHNGYSQQYGPLKRYRPPGARTLRLVPLRTSGKYPQEWGDVVDKGKEKLVTVDTSKNSLGEYFYTAEKSVVKRKDAMGAWEVVREDLKREISLLRDFRLIDQTLKALVRPPVTDAADELVEDEDGMLVYEKGITTLICGDGNVRPRTRQTLETGRWAMRDPNLQNLSVGKEGEIARVCDLPVEDISVRSVFKAYDADHPLSGGEDWFFVEPDYSGAELLMVAIMSQDYVMIDHCLRNTLDEDDPNFYDIHSSITARAFQLKCAPTKAGLKSVGKLHLRVVGKSVVFGLMYGRSPRAIAIALRATDGVFISAGEAKDTQQALFDMYPGLLRFMQECKERAVNPGWLRNMFGRHRRFPYTEDEKQIAKFGREAMNAPIQGGVADAVSKACRNFIDYRDKHNMRFRLCLQIHDAIMLHVPASEMRAVVDRDRGVVKKCMIDMIPLVARDLSGKKIPGAEEQRFGSSMDIFERWGVPPSKERLARNNLQDIV